MTEEEKESIKFNLKQVEDSYELHAHNSLRKSIKEALDLIEAQSYNEKVLLEAMEKKDKTINSMARYIATLDIDEDIRSKTGRSECDLMALGECEKCIIEYFEKKEG